MQQSPSQKASLSVWIDWLLHLHSDEIDLGVKRVKQVACEMGLQSPSTLVISVAGTNGKGSSVAMLRAIYLAAGYRVGCFTSPHILTFNERFSINDRLATDDEIVRAFCEIEQARGETKLTFFEFSTLAALSIFAQYELDVILLEVGLGGRLDAVNLVDSDASLITAIDVDHVEWLGDDREQIAKEKFGITRPSCLAVCSEPNLPETAIEMAQANQVNLVRLGQEYRYDLLSDHWVLKSGEGVQKLPLPSLKGDFQIQNASGVVTLVQALSNQLFVKKEAIEAGLLSSHHSGRLQTLQVGEANWLLDVAHNPQSALALASYLDDLNFHGKAIFSALSDKDMLPMIKCVAPFVSDWYLADLHVNRSQSLSELKRLLGEAGISSRNIHAFDDVFEGVRQVLSGASTDAVLVFGSFFTVSQAISELTAQKPELVI